MGRILTLTSLLFLLFVAAHGQDVIVRRNGSTIEGKVTEVGVDKVLYRISQEADAASFAIRKNELLRIEFENGKTVWFDRRRERSSERSTVRDSERGRERNSPVLQDEESGRNKVDFSAFKALDSGPGFGISYERIMDKNGYFGLLLPLTLTISDNYYFPIGSQSTQNEQMYYFSPSLKIYPFGQRRVTYAVGPTVYAGVGKRWFSYTEFIPETQIYMTHEENRDRFRMGMIVNNYVNFQITKHFQIGLNAGAGPRYVDRETFGSKVYKNRGMEITGEFNFNLGFRF